MISNSEGPVSPAPFDVAEACVAAGVAERVADGMAVGSTAAFPDMSAARAEATRSTDSAQHEVLTGLPNRALLADRIGHAISLSRRHLNKVAVLFLNLDGFKHIHDSLGHPLGDSLVQSITRRLVDCVRGSDTVSWEGGDEVVALLSQVEQSADAAITARRMLRAMSDTHLIDRDELHVTTSIGVSIYPDDGVNAETLIKNANTAMSQAKEDGRGRYRFFKPAIQVRAVERQFIEEGLQHALERQEFALHYQPKINLRTGDITAAEAVIRWTHPTRGPIPAAQFIPVAENCGMILPIGRWVLRQACKQARAWLDAGLPPITMAVNISAGELRDENFLEGVFAILKDTDLDPRSLELEVTESALLKGAEPKESILKALRERGVGLVVDDFGTGYYGMSAVKRVPIDTLKIDASFVPQLATAPQEPTIVAAIIGMGRSLGLRIVAKGVETPADLAFIQSQRCDEAQGSYVSPPVHPQQFGKLLADGISETVLRGLAPKRRLDVQEHPRGGGHNEPPTGPERISLGGSNYKEGSIAHLAKIDQMHKAEIEKQNVNHVKDLAERKDLEDRTRLVNDKLERDLRTRTAALADGKLADAHSATQQSEDRFRLLVNGVKDYALFMLDPAGTVATWNAGAERIKGYKEEEIVGKHLSTFYEPADAQSGLAQKNLAMALETGRAEEEGRRVRKDGSTFWASMVLSPIYDPAGVLIGFGNITHDLTERRHMEDQLIQSQKMEALGRLAGGVAHDFNNLLSAVLSYSEMLAADLKEGDPMREGLEEITGAGLRAVDLTKQLLAFSRQQVLQTKIVDLTEIVVGMEKMLRRLIGEDVELTAACAPVLGKVRVDPGQIEQVIMNLALNARDALPRGGRVTIETADVVLDEEFAKEHEGVKPGPHVMLAVTDSGIGMDRATQDRIFEPFFTTKGAGKGTGLGLATVFGVVRQSGGTIWVYSEPEKGTAFKVYLPMIDSTHGGEAAHHHLPLDSRRLHGSETILLVDDDESVRALTRTILRKYGYNLLVAQGGGDAFLLCEQYKATIHLLLTDVVMPLINGQQLAERLLMVRPDMKVLYMSGYTDDAVVRHGVLQSALAFIQKPITPQALARKVREVLGPEDRFARDQRA